MSEDDSEAGLLALNLAACAYGQDPVQPTTVLHGHEFGDPDPADPDRFGYRYNVLYYVFRDGDRGVQARHYLDEPDHASLFELADLDDPVLRRVLIFLALRYERIDHLVEGGFRPLAEATRAELGRLTAAHMRREGAS